VLRSVLSTSDLHTQFTITTSSLKGGRHYFESSICAIRFLLRLLLNLPIVDSIFNEIICVPVLLRDVSLLRDPKLGVGRKMTEFASLYLT
jgi:hypothetical protein